MTKSHEIYIGEEVERAIEIIGEESEEHTSWGLLDRYADGNLDLDIELRGNYLRVIVHE